MRGDVRAGLALGHRERAHGAALQRRVRPSARASPRCRRARIGSDAERLQREHRVGERRSRGQRLAREAAGAPVLPRDAARASRRAPSSASSDRAPRVAPPRRRPAPARGASSRAANSPTARASSRCASSRNGADRSRCRESASRELAARAWRGTPRRLRGSSGCSMSSACTSASCRSASSRSSASSRVERLLGDRERRARGRAPARSASARASASSRSRAHDALVEADLVRALGASMKSPVISSSVARPEPTRRGSSHDGAHVGAREPDAHEQERDLRRLGAAMRMSQARRDHRAGAGHGAVERRDHRAAAAADGEDQIAGHARELAQPCGVALEQRADDVLDVAARAERAARAGEHDRAHAGLGVERAERVAQLGVDLEGQRVQPRRAGRA